MLKFMKVKHVLYILITVLCLSYYSPKMLLTNLNSLKNIDYVNQTMITYISDKVQQIGYNNYRTAVYIQDYFTDTVTSTSLYIFEKFDISTHLNPKSKQPVIKEQHGVKVTLNPVTDSIYAVYIEHGKWIKGLNISFDTLGQLGIKKIVGGLKFKRQFPLKLNRESNSISGYSKDKFMLRPGKRFVCYVITKNSSKLKVDHITYFGDPKRATSFFRGS